MAQKRHGKRHNAYFSKNYFENAAWQAQKVVCGIDEVGRGCLAGPLVTAAVILPIGTKYSLLKDSKILTEAERLMAAQWIIQNCQYAYGIVHNRIIDTHNIYQATLMAMQRSLYTLLQTSNLAPEAVLVDAMPLSLARSPYSHISIHSFPYGEDYSTSIAAASIIAKVKRDALMQELSQFFPGYHLESHKGYGTPLHCKSLVRTKPSLIHRMTFIKTVFKSRDEEENQQINMF